MNLLPAKMQATAKAWVSLLGVIVAAVVASVDEVPRWVTIVGAVLASIGAYLVPNQATEPATLPPASDGTPSATDLPESSEHAAE